MGQRREKDRGSLRVESGVKRHSDVSSYPSSECLLPQLSLFLPIPPSVLFVIWSMAQLWIGSPSKWSPRVSIFFPDSDFFGKSNHIWSTMMLFSPFHLVVPHIHCVMWESSWVLLYTLQSYMIKSLKAKWAFSPCLWWWLLNQNRSCNWKIRQVEPIFSKFLHFHLMT